MQQFKTRHSLLLRACDPQDDEAWCEFEKHYHLFIFHILRHLEVPEDDRADLGQQILVMLTSDLPSYDRSRAKFRTWLSQVIRNRSRQYFRDSNRARKRINSYAEVNDDLFDYESPQIDEMIQREWETYVSTLAMKRVKKVFSPRAIEVFESSLDGRSSAQIAQDTGLTVSSVYTLKKRVKKSLILEIRKAVSELER